jgi:hypothetical protein
VVHREGFEPVTVLVLSQVPPTNWATGAIDCQMEPPLPTQLWRQKWIKAATALMRLNWSPSRESNTALPLTRRLHLRNASGACGAGDRTPGLRFTRTARYRLSYASEID